MRPSTLDALCAKYGIDRATDPLLKLPRLYTSFGDFEDTVVASCFNTLREPADIERIISEMAEDAVKENVVYIEPAFGMAGLCAKKWSKSEREVWDVVFAASRAAEAKTGVVVRWMVPSVRHFGPEHVMQQARLAVEMLAAGEPVVSFGLHASEGKLSDGRGPFPPEPFEDAFRVATGAGLIATPHAGEFLGAESCRGAVEKLQALRLQHGVRAVECHSTLALLRDRQVCCDVCPTSNVLLQVASSMEKHPLPALLAAGVQCTINVDDSLLFGASILDEYRVARETLGLSDEQLRACARASIVNSGVLLRAKRGFRDDAVSKLEAYLKEIDLWAADGGRKRTSLGIEKAERDDFNGAAKAKRSCL